MADAIHDAEHLVMIATATAELARLQEQAEAVLERVRPALASFNGIAIDIANAAPDDWDWPESPFFDASGLTAFGARITDFCDALRQAEDLNWLLEDER